MDLLLYILIFLLGSAVGSFLGVWTDRSQTGESVVKGRSRCDHCKHKLSSLDLIPLFSFLLLRGKCRYCHKKLSFYYPIIEAVTGTLFVLTVLAFGQGAVTAYYLFIASILIALFFTDLKYGILPFSMIFSGVIVSFLYLVLTSASLLLNHLFSAVGAFVFFLLIFLGTIFITKKEGMGFGDVVYAFLMGLLLGFPKIVLGLYIAFVGGAMISLLLVALKKKTFKGGSVPFGPFLIFGTIISIVWGDGFIEMITVFLR